MERSSANLLNPNPRADPAGANVTLPRPFRDLRKVRLAHANSHTASQTRHRTLRSPTGVRIWVNLNRTRSATYARCSTCRSPFWSIRLRRIIQPEGRLFPVMIRCVHLQNSQIFSELQDRYPPSSEVPSITLTAVPVQDTIRTGHLHRREKTLLNMPVWTPCSISSLRPLLPPPPGAIMPYPREPWNNGKSTVRCRAAYLRRIGEFFGPPRQRSAYLSKSVYSGRSLGISEAPNAAHLRMPSMGGLVLRSWGWSRRKLQITYFAEMWRLLWSGDLEEPTACLSMDDKGGIDGVH